MTWSGAARDGMGGANSIHWGSKYGSLIASGALRCDRRLGGAGVCQRQARDSSRQTIQGGDELANLRQPLAIQEYWKDAGSLLGFLPGTPRAADRFARALVYLDSIPTESKKQCISGVPQQKFQFQAMMSVLSVMRSVGTPLGIDVNDQPWVSSTIWSKISDSSNRVLMFDSAMAPATFWVKLEDLDRARR